LASDHEDRSEGREPFDDSSDQVGDEATGRSSHFSKLFDHFDRKAIPGTREYDHVRSEKAAPGENEIQPAAEGRESRISLGAWR
jgi:hypothetical protein